MFLVLIQFSNVVVSFQLFGTRLCFVSAHLAAHQGNTLDRNRNTYDIIRSIRVGDPDFDFTNQFHHCFWYGGISLYCSAVLMTDGTFIAHRTGWVI